MSLRITWDMKDNNKGKILVYNDGKERSESWEAYLISDDGYDIMADGYGYDEDEAIANMRKNLQDKIDKLQKCLHITEKVRV